MTNRDLEDLYRLNLVLGHSEALRGVWMMGYNQGAGTSNMDTAAISSTSVPTVKVKVNPYSRT